MGLGWEKGFNCRSEGLTIIGTAATWRWILLYVPPTLGFQIVAAVQSAKIEIPFAIKSP